jgi:undecaprenyl-diphosphatase
MLHNIDLAILYFLNHSLANPALDLIFVTVSETWFLIGTALALFIIFSWDNRQKGWLVLILAVLCIAATDSSTFALKKLFCNLRPCHSLDDLRLIAGCGGKYGFPSNHAANTFGFTFFMSYFYRRSKTYLFGLATLVCLSRVYLGKHYPSDVLAGAVWGIAVAFIILFLIKFATIKFYKCTRIEKIFS